MGGYMDGWRSKRPLCDPSKNPLFFIEKMLRFLEILLVKNSSPFFSKLVRVRDSNFYTFERYHKALSLLLLVLFAQIFSWQNIGRAVSHGESRVIKLTICQQMIDSKECVPKKWDLFG